MESASFEELDVYRLAAELSDAIRPLVRQWEPAADAIGADIAEAYGRGTRPDQARFLFMARGSAYELQHWLARAHAAGLACPPGAEDRARRIGQMLNGLIRSLGRSPSNRPT